MSKLTFLGLDNYNKSKNLSFSYSVTFYYRFIKANLTSWNSELTLSLISDFKLQAVLNGFLRLFLPVLS